MRQQSKERDMALRSRGPEEIWLSMATEGSRCAFIDISRFGYPTVHGAGATPVPIPNTEVKPCFGDGTAGFPGGRVARRWDLLNAASVFGPAPRSCLGAGSALSKGRLGLPGCSSVLACSLSSAAPSSSAWSLPARGARIAGARAFAPPFEIVPAASADVRRGTCPRELAV